MVMPWIALLLLSAISLTIGTPTALLPKRQSSRDDLVAGIDWRDESGNVPLRHEVHDLKTNFPDQWNLYILALDAMQRTDQQDSSSYYAVAGIHGRPYKTWNNATGLPYKVGTTGYCPHNNALFLGWHRPYLALFEKELYDHMQDMAMIAPADQVDRYSTAADSFRMPYWDWARGQAGGGVPEFFTEPFITVVTLNGTAEEIRNPLYAYYFRPLIPKDFAGKWASANTTLRWPASENPWEESRNDHFVSNFLDIQRTYQDGVEMAFRKSRLNTFGQQIEEVHGWMHGTIGGGYSTDKGGQGHMWPLEYSAFEPLFWLHHTNIDRLFALYQIQNPGTWLEPSNVGSNGNVFIENDAIVDADTPLLPFRRTPSSFWTTNEIRDTTVFGYAYPETISSNQSAAKAAVSRLYSGSTRARLTAQLGSIKGHLLLEENRTFTDWVINTAADPLSLPPTFIVRFSFVGDFSSDVVREVGMWSILMPMEHSRVKCTVGIGEEMARSSEKLMKGAVGITASLLDEISTGRLESLQAVDVIPFLKDRLTWKIYSGNGTQLSRSDLEAITIEVASTKAHIPSDSNDPMVYSHEVETYPGITLKHDDGNTT